MADDPNSRGDLLPAEMPLLLFHAAGVALGVEAAAVEGIVDAGEARQSGIAFGTLAGLLGTVGAPAPAKVLLFKGRAEPFGVGIDGLDAVIVLPTTALQPLPEPLSFYRGPRAFWGVAVRENKVVLLVDVDRLLEPAAALEAARS